MDSIKRFIKQEHEYFEKLGTDAQHLLFSYVLSGITDPILWIFLNAFIWEKSNNNLLLVGWYNLAFFIGIPLGFYVNGQLLKKFASPRIYLIGCVSQAVVVSFLIFLSLINYQFLFAFGIIFGLATGLYWGNRNLLSLRSTTAENRIYFASLESTFSTPVSILSPLLVGWFIYFGGSSHLYTKQEAYQIVGLFSIVSLFITGFIVRNVTISLTPIKHLIIQKASSHWHIFRSFMILNGIQGGVTIFLPTIILLTLLGRENALGTVQSAASLFSAIAIYFVGRMLHSRHRVRIFFISFLLYFLGSLFYGVLFSAIGVLIYFAFASLQAPFAWSSFASLTQDTIDTEEKNSPYNHYGYVLDQEVFLNVGRIIGIFLLYFLIQKFSNTFALRYTPFILASTQVLLIFLASLLDKKNLR